MSSRRSAKVAQAILECVSSTILSDLKDPRVKNVTVTGAEVSPDFRSAKIKVSVMGDEKTRALTMRGLESARGFLQSKVAERLEIRYTPILKFVVDRGVKLSIETSKILRDLRDELPDEIRDDSELGRETALSDDLRHSTPSEFPSEPPAKHNPPAGDCEIGPLGADCE